MSKGTIKRVVKEKSKKFAFSELMKSIDKKYKIYRIKNARVYERWEY